MTIAKNLFPNETRFSQSVLQETETDYSGRLWEEVRYELSATYSDEEIKIIEAAFAGGEAAFERSRIEQRFTELARNSQPLVNLLRRRPVAEILGDLYRLGAIGNSFRAGTTGNVFRNRWSFRGDRALLIDKRMVLHPGLLKHLSAVAQRRRGTKGGRG